MRNSHGLKCDCSGFVNLLASCAGKTRFLDESVRCRLEIKFRQVSFLILLPHVITVHHVLSLCSRHRIRI